MIEICIHRNEYGESIILLIDGVEIQDGYTSKMEEDCIELSILDNNLSRRIMDYTFEELFESVIIHQGDAPFINAQMTPNADLEAYRRGFYSLTSIHLYLAQDNEDAIFGQRKVTLLSFPQLEEEMPYMLTFPTVYGMSGWKYPWSAIQYASEFARIYYEIGSGEARSLHDRVDFNETVLSSFVGQPISSVKAIIYDEIVKCLPRLQYAHRQTVEILSVRARSQSLMTAFDFPEPLRIPCEQYLVYFVQFLEDLGVPATYDLRHEANRVLFTVTPDDKDEALDNIRQALEIYLRLPTNPGVNIPNDYSLAMPVQQLMAQLQHLQSQITLKNAELEFKNATIQALQYTVQQQRPQLTAEVMSTSLQEVNEQPVKPEKEEFLGGAFAIKKYEGDGFDVNIPMIYRWVKEVLNRSRRQK